MLNGTWNVKWTAPFYPVRPYAAKDLVLKGKTVEIKDVVVEGVSQKVAIFDDDTDPLRPIKITVELETKSDGAYETCRGRKMMSNFTYDFSARANNTEITALTIRRVGAEDSGGQWGGNK